DHNPEQNYLANAFVKHHFSRAPQTHQISGSNQDGLMTAPQSGASVAIIPQSGSSSQTDDSQIGDQTKIIASGPHTEIEVILGKTAYEALGGYKLISFKVDGVPYSLGKPSHCRWIHNTLDSAALDE
ncbi:MAG: hypothetical protein RBT63_10250, partial [Bdellovibrionales bacterium]|nr:hypothetical protein [Bdellovibrionales bacterium]